MYKYLTIIVSLFIFVMACNGQKTEFTSEGANFFGAKITDQGFTNLALVDLPTTQSDTLDIKLKGQINEVCQAKGCWMTLESDDSDHSVFIKFKDYAFFVPKDASGKDAIISGKLYASVTSVDELRHYAEDKGKSAEEVAAITEPEREIRMMADGVIIYN